MVICSRGGAANPFDAFTILYWNGVDVVGKPRTFNRASGMALGKRGNLIALLGGCRMEKGTLT